MINMKCLIVLISLLTSNFLWSQDMSLSQYRFGAGDQIKINVFGQADLSLTKKLPQSGVIKYPFLGDVTAVGLTAAELEAKISNGLKGDYLINPTVSVTVLDYRPFFINGEIKKPGKYSYQADLSVEKAVALAGGYTERSSIDKIVIRRNLNGQQQLNGVQLTDVVFPGDIITIPKSFF